MCTRFNIFDNQINTYFTLDYLSLNLTVRVHTVY